MRGCFFKSLGREEISSCADFWGIILRLIMFFFVLGCGYQIVQKKSLHGYPSSVICSISEL